jgi:hypothetical protein
MPVSPDHPPAAAHARPPLTTRGLKPTDINPDEMDDVIMRIFKELRKQLSIMEAKTAADLEPADRERHARILASLEHTMERLVKLEAGRAAARKNTASMTHEQKRALLLRKLTVQATLERAGEDSGAHG